MCDCLCMRLRVCELVCVRYTFFLCACHILMSFCFTLIYFHLNSFAKWLQGAHKNAIMHSLKKLIANNVREKVRERVSEREMRSHACECALLKIRQIRSKSKKCGQLATGRGSGSGKENQQAGFVLASAAVFVSVCLSVCLCVLYIAPMAACLLCRK